MEWFNQVDATYRADLRELNELTFSRFDAKLEQRIAESDARWERRLADLTSEIFDVKADLIIAPAGVGLLPRVLLDHGTSPPPRLSPDTEAALP